VSKISVVLPVYNGEKYVKNAIRSVLEQTHHDLELIIVNDCSTDSTQSVISACALEDDRIRIVNNETNQKLPRSLNIGFQNANGDYWTWTSDDNLFHPTALEKMADILDSNANIDLVYADFSIVDMDGNVIQEIKCDEPEGIRFKDNVGACFLYRRSLAEKAGEYDPSMFLAEDYEFFIRCYKNGKFYHLGEDLYDYGRHEKNLSATRNKEIRRQAFHVMNVHFDYLYSECHTQMEQNRLLYEMLALLDDSKEKKMIRKKYYKINKGFACTDRKKRIKRVTDKGIVCVKRILSALR